MPKSSPLKLARYRWRNMIGRCYDPNHVGYENYGGRGLTVCDGWRVSFDAYYAATGDKPFPGATIDRTNNDLGYFCGECSGEARNWRWATYSEQRRNQRDLPNYETRKTECVNGHPYNEQNTRVYHRKRVCKTCQREHVRRYAKRKAEAA